MQNETLLKSIWNGNITTTQSRFSKEVKGFLNLLLPFQTVCLRDNSMIASSRIIPEEIELLPALPLGDILAEELSIDVPLGSMVVVLKEQNSRTPISQPDVSYQLGLIIGEVLLGIIGDGVFPLGYEAEALRVMANSYVKLVENFEGQQQKICSTSFHTGLSHSISEYWAGPAQNDLNISNIKAKATREMALFSGYLKVLNRYEWARTPNQRYVNLTEIDTSLCTPFTWKNNLVEAVLGGILLDKSHAYNL